MTTGREKFDRLIRELTDHMDPSDAAAFRRGYDGAERAAKPLPQIRGRRESGVLWVRAEDVADALEVAAPETNARLIKKLRG